MDLVLQTPSLQHIAEVKIVAALWSSAQIMPEIAQIFENRPSLNMYGETSEEWKELENRVKWNAEALSLPPGTRKQITLLIFPIGYQIFDWCWYYSQEVQNFHSLKYVIPLPRRFYFTMRGTVDYKKTAESVVNEETAGLEERYIVACINCLEDEAGRLIRRIPENRRWEMIDAIRDLDYQTYGCDSTAFFTFTLSDRWDLLQTFFSEDRETRGKSIYQYLFENSVLNGFQSACEYFFEKLNRRERERVLSDGIVSSCQSHTEDCRNLLHLWSLLNAQQREIVLRRCCFEVLLWLSDWPLQSLFVETAKCGAPFLNHELHENVLYRLLQNIENGTAPLFLEFWDLTSASYKQRFLESDFRCMLLFETKVEDIMKLALNEAPWPSLQALRSGSTGKRALVALSDEAAISKSALTECAEGAAFVSANDEGDAEKRLRSQHLRQLVDCVMEVRNKKKQELSLD